MKKVVFCIGILFGMPFLVGAQANLDPPDEAVVINEIAWMGSPVENVDSRQEG